MARYAASPIPLWRPLDDPLARSSFSGHNQISALSGRRELEARGGDGLDVRLWWDPASNRVTVTVAGSKSGLELQAPVRDGEAPLDVFRHPFAYAADRGLELRPAGAGRVPVGDRQTAWEVR